MWFHWLFFSSYHIVLSHYYPRVPVILICSERLTNFTIVPK